jgi:hypothetical protein
VIQAFSLSEPVILVSGVALVFACGCATLVALLEIDLVAKIPERRPLMFLERERDLAAALGWPWRRWLAFRLVVVAAAAMVGVWSGVWSVGILFTVIALFGVRFGVAGRAARRRLRMERAFLGQLRTLRDRMAIGNQSLDTALQEIGRSPGRDLAYVLGPLKNGGSTSQNIVMCAMRSRSSVVEQACAVLLWSRTRSLDALIEAIDTVLLPVGEAQLAIEEESLVTLTQQRAVAFAMAALMLFMFLSIARVESFRHYYQSFAGTIVLAVVICLFAALIAILGRIVRVTRWTRWDLQKMADQEAQPHA